TLFSLLLRRTVSLSERLLIGETLNYDNMHGIVRLAKHIIIGTLCIEGLGAAVLFPRFFPRFGFWGGLYKAVFHSVSAFCNAGFDTLSAADGMSNLGPYAFDAPVVLTLSALVLVGGAGFYVWEDLYTRGKRLKLHTKLALLVSAVLLVLGTVCFYVFEYHNPRTMLGMSGGDRLLASFLQSVSTRTSGFHNISQRGLTPSSKIVAVFLMFIGGSPGSTAGGIKTVTFGVLIFTALAVARGTQNVNIFGKRVSHSVILRSLTIVMISMFVVICGVIALSVTENAPLSDLVFEAVSAFGTSGLTSGITPRLTNAGKITIIVLMYFGRVGVLTVALGLMRGMNSAAADKIKYPEEKIMVG
ncbi:MAG: Trk family potassium uptake protein, partial [Clostridiales bacterium]|nr:Trk family potassium uptake protein [Clostridiales bacterium]